MRQTLTFLLLLMTEFIVGQSAIEIYRGQKLPFEIYYITVTDTTREIEFFYEKGGQIFGHIPAKRLVDTKTGFKSKDDSITVVRADKYLLVKAKGHSGKTKLFRSAEKLSDIEQLRQRNRSFRHYQDSVKVGQ